MGAIPDGRSTSRKTHRTCPSSGRAADGEMSAGHPSMYRASPTDWYGGQDSWLGGGISRPARRSCDAVLKSATREILIFHFHRLRGIIWFGRKPFSESHRYHSAHAVASVSAK
jgi:hypothetical protein